MEYFYKLPKHIDKQQTYYITIMERKVILVATEKPFASTAIEGIRSAVENVGYELRLLEKYSSKTDLLTAVSNVDALIVRSDIVDAEVLNAGKKLKIVVRAGAGYDNIDLVTAKNNGVVVMNTPGQNSNAVAELVGGLMVYAFRNFYDGSTGSELKGKKLGIHAFGNVGRNVARVAKGFGMDVYAYDAYCPKEVMEQAGVHCCTDVKEMYTTCDVISLHLPATDETKGSINYDLLSLMPKNGLLVNTARKEIINEEDVLKLMGERENFKYVTDIHPDAHDQFVARCGGRYFATPKKMGAQTKEANINAGIAAAKQIVDFFVNGNTKFQLNK